MRIEQIILNICNFKNWKIINSILVEQLKDIYRRCTSSLMLVMATGVAHNVLME